jgi:hypothetical protein
MSDNFDLCGEFLRFAKRVNWPVTMLSLQRAQLRSAAQERADSERLWTEENA